MVWIRVDDRYSEHPKIADVGPLGVSLWLAGLAYCNRNLTDGKIPWAAARALVSWEYLEPPDTEGKRRIVTVGVTSGFSGDDVNSDYVIRLLVKSGLWEEHPGYYYVHDYPDYQPLKSKVLLEREKTLERVRKHRQENSSNVGGNGVTNGEVTPHPEPVPVPKKKEPCAALAGFAEFWALYPKKRSKETARKAWATLQPQNGLVETILAALALQSKTPDWIKEGGQFVPYAATWLHRKQWEDEIPSNGHGRMAFEEKYPRL